MIGSLVGGAVLSLLGLKKLFLFGWTLASIGSILLTIFTNLGNITALLLFITIFGISFAFLGCYMSPVLLFPTILKSSSMGFCNFFGRLAGIFAPLVAELEQPINFIILIGTSIIAGIISQFLIVPNKRD